MEAALGCKPRTKERTHREKDEWVHCQDKDWDAIRRFSRKNDCGYAR